MAKPTKRTSRARKSSKGSKRSGRKPGSVTVSRSKITFMLTPKEMAQAKACLTKSGQIRIGFKELRITRLPTTLDDGKEID